MIEYLNKIKEAMPILKDTLRDDPKRLAQQIGWFEGYLNSAVSLGKGRVNKTIRLDSFRYGYIETCEVSFVGSLKVPLVTNINFNLKHFIDYSGKPSFTPEKDILPKLVLYRTTEAMITNTILSLIPLGHAYALNNCKNDGGYSLKEELIPSLSIVKKTELGLVFDHNQKPDLIFMYNPEIISDIGILPNTKSFEVTEYGNNMSALQIGLQEVHKVLLKKLFL